MDWKGVVGPLLQQFAPKLAKGLLGQIPVIGPMAVAFGGQAIDAAIGGLLAQVFDVEATPEAVSEAIQTTPSDEAADKLKDAERQAEAKWPALAQIAVAEEQTAQVQIAATTAQMKQEVLASTELKEGGWRTFSLAINAIWRPLFAMEFLAECTFFFFGFTGLLMAALIKNDAFDIDAMMKLMPLALGLLLPYLAMRAGLIGYHMNLRTREREGMVEAVTDAPKPVVMDDIKAMLKSAGLKVK